MQENNKAPELVHHTQQVSLGQCTAPLPEAWFGHPSSTRAPACTCSPKTFGPYFLAPAPMPCKIPRHSGACVWRGERLERPPMRRS